MSALPWRILFHFFNASFAFFVAGKRALSIFHCCWMILDSMKDSNDGMVMTMRPPFFTQAERDWKKIVLSFNEEVRIALMQIAKSHLGTLVFLPLISARRYSTFLYCG